MKNPNLLIISNRFSDLMEDLKVKYIKWDDKELCSILDWDGLIIDFSFDENNENTLCAGVYDELISRFSSELPLVVIVICGYPNKSISIEEIPFPSNSDEWSRHPPSVRQNESYRFLREFLGNSIYNNLRFEEIENYDRESLKDPFKEYFKLSKMAYLFYEDNFEVKEIKAISKLCGVGRNYCYAGVVIRIKKGIIILLPAYDSSKKTKAFTSIIEISKKFHKEQQRKEVCLWETIFMRMRRRRS